eukprot:4835067-Pleurochrysis_carterae.AAC.1
MGASVQRDAHDDAAGGDVDLDRRERQPRRRRELTRNGLAVNRVRVRRIRHKVDHDHRLRSRHGLA